MRDEKANVTNEVVTTYKVITKKVPRVVAERRKWAKFGQSQEDGPGPQLYTTYVAEEVQMQFTRNRGGVEESAQPDANLAGGNRTVDAKAHCRICKANDHWSVHCPYKVRRKSNIPTCLRHLIFLGNYGTCNNGRRSNARWCSCIIKSLCSSLTT